MKILGATLLILPILASCGPKNVDFAPFDEEYIFHRNFVLSDYDTILVECGYWNLTNRHDGTYYQFYSEDDDIVAKGFSLTFDSIEVRDFDEDNYVKILLEVQKDQPADTNKIKLVLKPYQPIFFLYDTTMLTTLKIIDRNDSIHFAEVSAFWNGWNIERQIQYFNSKPQPSSR